MAGVKTILSIQDFSKIPVLGFVPESSSTAPSSPVAGQLWNDTTNNLLKRWNGSSWDIVGIGGTAGGDLTGTFPNPTIAAGAVSTAKLADSAVTSAKINAALKPSGSAAAGDEALRALGFTSGTAMPGTARLDQIAGPQTHFSMGGYRLLFVADPTQDTDAANKRYVDLMRQGLRQKDAVKVATTANITLSGTQTIDGVAVVADDRVLVKDQSTASANGIYVVAAGAWSRATDADAFGELQDGTVTFVQQGTTQANTSWAQTSTLTSLSDSQAWVQQGAASTYTGTTNRITVSGGTIDIAPTYAGQASITTLGTVTTGVWNGTAVAVANGGTGATTAAGARSNLSATGKYSSTVGALAAGTPTTVTHNLGTTEVIASFRYASNDDPVEVAWEPSGTNTIAVTAAVPLSSGTLKVVVVG